MGAGPENLPPQPSLPPFFGEQPSTPLGAGERALDRPVIPMAITPEVVGNVTIVAPMTTPQGIFVADGDLPCLEDPLLLHDHEVADEDLPCAEDPSTLLDHEGMSPPENDPEGMSPPENAIFWQKKKGREKGKQGQPPRNVPPCGYVRVTTHLHPVGGNGPWKNWASTPNGWWWTFLRAKVAPQVHCT